MDGTHEHTFQIIVNTKEEQVPSDIVTYDQVTSLAYPTPPVQDPLYTVTYEKGADPQEGSLVEGQSVRVRNGTEFDVVISGKS